MVRDEHAYGGREEGGEEGREEGREGEEQDEIL